jgi:TusA-related sulfurtransferase
MVQKAVKDGPAALEVLADAQVAVENISRFAASQGYNVSVTPNGDEFKLTLTK